MQQQHNNRLLQAIWMIQYNQKMNLIIRLSRKRNWKAKKMFKWKLCQKQRIQRLVASTAKRTHIETYLNFSSNQQNVQEHMVQLVNRKTDYGDTIMKTDIKYNIKSPMYYEDGLHPDWVYNMYITNL